MTADLVLLTLAFAFLAGGLSHLVISIKRMVCRWFREALDAVAVEMR